ncbi:hypothetical protein Nepgr_006568 [Nepenthes gracilis]|uniref:Uncharacterized protein n=1 Tax=Nepenthes gracilis TaxID=150966 RepID=A0AAD3S5A2_NEPGR|nr:hypothetical protein Nepgr_006568 [Nepenthes gracilis]
MAPPFDASAICWCKLGCWPMCLDTAKSAIPSSSLLFMVAICIFVSYRDWVLALDEQLQFCQAGLDFGPILAGRHFSRALVFSMGRWIGGLRHFACQWVLDAAGHFLQQAEELATAWRMLCKMVQNPTGWTVAGSCDGGVILLLYMLGAPGFGGDLIGCECISGLSFTLAAGGGHALRASVPAGFLGRRQFMSEAAVPLWLDMLWALLQSVLLFLLLSFCCSSDLNALHPVLWMTISKYEGGCIFFEALVILLITICAVSQIPNKWLVFVMVYPLLFLDVAESSLI